MQKHAEACKGYFSPPACQQISVSVNDASLRRCVIGETRPDGAPPCGTRNVTTSSLNRPGLPRVQLRGLLMRRDVGYMVDDERRALVRARLMSCDWRRRVLDVHRRARAWLRDTFGFRAIVGHPQELGAVAGRRDDHCIGVIPVATMSSISMCGAWGAGCGLLFQRPRAFEARTRRYCADNSHSECL